ncbi:MAG: putative transporter [Paludibacteraceae bacterium]|nr:putative transporter [Paludibacteraceae bacterium]
MDFLTDLFTRPGITQTLLLLTLTIALGLFCSEKLKIKQFGLGVTWILFAGILISALGAQVDTKVAGFAKDFGLILFVYSIGLQVGPSFFSSLGQGGLRLNLLAASVVVLGCLCTVVLHFITGVDMATMVGVMSGAVTNTPSLGAAQQAFADLFGEANPTIATGYAVAYPLGVIGIILSIAAIRWIGRVSLKDEEQKLQETEQKTAQPMCVDIQLDNPRIMDITAQELKRLCPVEFVLSRVIHANGEDEIVDEQTRFGSGDTIRVLVLPEHLPTLELLGNAKEHKLRSNEDSQHLISRRIVVTKPEWNGKRIGNIDLRGKYHVTLTRVNRAGIDLLATPNLVLQLGDRIVVVGDKDDVQRVGDIFGNELKRLDVPNLLPIFLGIGLGIILGMLPLPIPGMSQQFKLGLAGGALIVALLIGRFGPYYRLVTFATTSANRMLREVGLALFLAAVGLGAGSTFIPTIMDGGYMWILYGFLITVVPLLLVGFVGYKLMHINYFTIAGMLSGSMTDPPALAYSSALSDNNDQASVAYATVYPLTMFLRVMAGQLMIILACS